VRIILANSFHYRRGGDSNQFLLLVEALEQRGHEVATFAMHHPQNLPSRWGTYWVPHVEYRRRFTLPDRFRAAHRSVYSADSRRNMLRLIADFAPDVVHFHGVHHHLTLAAVDACLAAKAPVVWTLHDGRTVCPATLLLRGDEVCERCAGGRFWHAAVGRCKSGEMSRSLVAALESYSTRVRGTLGAVSCYVTPSRFLAQKVAAMGLPARRIEVVPNPVAAGPTPGPDRPRRGGLLYVGRLSAEKGVKHLIKAVAAGGDLRLRVVGDGPEGDRLKAFAAELRADVHFEGWRDADEVVARMSSAEALCVPSICYENCPGVALEAMASGLPVVASDLGGLPELLEGGRAGWLAPPADPQAWLRVITEALRDETRTAQQAARAFARVRERHDPDAFVDRLEVIYRSLAS